MRMRGEGGGVDMRIGYGKSIVILNSVLNSFKILVARQINKMMAVKPHSTFSFKSAYEAKRWLLFFLV